MRSSAIRSLRRSQAKCLSVIRRADIDEFPSESDARWLFENRFRLIKMTEAALSSIKRVKYLPVKDGGARIMELCRAVVDAAGGAISESDVIASVNGIQRGGDYLTHGELCHLYAYLLFACMEKISRAIATRDTSCIPNAVKLAFLLRELDFEQIYTTVSYTESILICDPAGLYVRCDGATKSMYRRKLSEISRRFSMGEYETAKLILNNARESTGRARHVGWHIQKYARHGVAAALYFPSLAIVPAIVSASLATLSYINSSAPLFFASILAYLPIRRAFKSMLDAYFCSREEPDILPRLSLDSIPPEGKTLLTYTMALTGNDDGTFTRLLTYARAFGTENLGFAILADLPDSKEKTDARDEALLSRARSYIDQINALGARAYLFWRDREQCRTERIYMGAERKRGAQGELFSLLSGGPSALHVYGGDPVGYKYVLALDADTEILRGDIMKLIATALHPCNEPLISRGSGYPIVTEGYGVIAPTAEISFVGGETRSRYTALRYAYGGRSEYERASFHIYSYLFGTGSFCGKGLINVDAYVKTVLGAFPRERILSHDAVEGIRLRCGHASDVRVYDTAPRDAIAERKRRHRWIRGDVQTWCLIGLNVTSESGERYKNPIGITGRMMTAEPAIDAASAVMRLPTMILALAGGGALGVVLYLFTVADHIFDALRLLTCAVSVPKRRYLSGAPDYYEAAAFTIFDGASSEADDAALTADAIYRAFYRLKLSHRHLLEWKTAAAADGESDGGVYAYVSSMKYSIIFGVIAFLTALASYGIPRLLLPIYGALWILYPMFMHRENSIPAYAERSNDAPEELTGDARLMWSFFADNVTRSHHYLPPDNVCLMPEPKTAARTSPTNIGLYLLSAVNAHDLGFIGTDELKTRLENTLLTVSELEKWRGHLYNWYDTETLSVLYPAYVSTVDSGNFIVCLVTVKNAVNTLDGFGGIIDVIDGIVGGVDFGALYKKKRNLFYIGYNSALDAYDPNVYDLYASEMLTTSFYAAAAGQVPSEHISSLGRVFSDDSRVPAMLSWSGSAFEYFMPSIFLPAEAGTSRYEALAAAVEYQRADMTAVDGLVIYGRSESSFYDFDDMMNYSYKAHGCDSLAISSEMKNEDVIAPYALYLLGMFDRGALSVLGLHRGGALYGKYGFYESVDATESRTADETAVVKQYMAHHVGMSIASAANILLDSINVKRFTSEPSVRAALPLLHESITINRRRAERRSRLRADTFNAPIGRERFDAAETDSAVISNGRIRIYAGKSGGVEISDGETLLTQPTARGCDGFFALIRVDGEVYSCTSGQRALFLTDGAVITFANEFVCGERIVKTELTFVCAPDSASAVCELSVAGAPDEIGILYMFSPVINDRAAYMSAPSYSDLFITAETIGRDTVRYDRKTKNGSVRHMFCSASSKNGGDITIHTRKSELFSFGRTADDVKSAFDAEPTDTGGACVHPVFAAVINARTDGGAHKSCVKISTDEPPLAVAADEARVGMEKHMRVMRALSGADASAVRCAMELAGAIYESASRITETDVMPAPYRRDIFWRYGISGDLPVVSVFCGDLTASADRFAVDELISAKRYLFLSGVRFDIVFIAPCAGYMSGGTGRLTSMANSLGAGRILGKNNGIFIIPRESVSPFDELTVIARSCKTVDIGVGHDFTTDKRTGGAAVPEAAYAARYAEIMYREGADGIIITNGKNKTPFSMVYANPAFGTLLTNLTCGYTWYLNSSLGVLSRRHVDPTLGVPGEAVYLHIGGMRYDMCRAADTVVWGRDCAVYSGELFGIRYELRIGVDAKLPAKLYHIKAAAESGELPESLRASISFYPAHPSICSHGRIYPQSEPSCRIAIYSVSDGIDDEILCETDHADAKCAFSSGECGFVAAVEPYTAHGMCIQYIRDKYRRTEFFMTGFLGYKKFVDDILLECSYAGKKRWLSNTVDHAAYQAVFVRMLARSGYDQSGGAYGFRDQLQDCLGALYYRSEIARLMILRACARQYEDGRVQHWWHAYPYGGGLKTRCGDDFMWLPYVAAEYVLSTGDGELLTARAPYLQSPPLKSGEDDRYETALCTEARATVLEHCIAAIKASFERGAHRLPLIGSGDWNDGMNEVGIRGRGESVWLAFFFAVVYRRFAEMMRELSIDPGMSERLMYEADALVAAAEENAWDGGWYVRAFDDDGGVIGSSSCAECRIDLMPQAFAVFADADRSRTSKALSEVKKRLYDGTLGILRLFEPSYSETTRHGYICRYPSGIRENGGQYTHAAIFCAAAYFAAGDRETGELIMSSVSPSGIYGAGKKNGKYTAEPYFLAADVYYGEGITGMSGWSGYTGSASWFYRVAMKYCLGVTLRNGCAVVTPPANIKDGYAVCIRVGGCSMKLSVRTDDCGADADADEVYAVRAGSSVTIRPHGESAKILVKVEK